MMMEKPVLSDGRNRAKNMLHVWFYYSSEPHDKPGNEAKGNWNNSAEYTSRFQGLE